MKRSQWSQFCSEKLSGVSGSNVLPSILWGVRKDPPWNHLTPPSHRRHNLGGRWNKDLKQPMAKYSNWQKNSTYKRSCTIHSSVVQDVSSGIAMLDNTGVVWCVCLKAEQPLWGTLTSYWGHCTEGHLHLGMALKLINALFAIFCNVWTCVLLPLWRRATLSAGQHCKYSSFLSWQVRWWAWCAHWSIDGAGKRIRHHCSGRRRRPIRCARWSTGRMCKHPYKKAP